MGVKLAEYKLESYSEQIISMIILRDEFFKEHLVLTNQKGDLYFFDLPFIKNGRKIESGNSQEIQVDKACSLRDGQSLVMQDCFGYMDVFSLIWFIER